MKLSNLLFLIAATLFVIGTIGTGVTDLLVETGAAHQPSVGVESLPVTATLLFLAGIVLRRRAS